MIEARTDVVGSLLRPAPLIRAREELAAGAIAPARFKAVEDRAVDAAVALQEDAGLDVVTDGEMRRLSFQSQMTQAVEGFGAWGLDAFLWGDWRGGEEIGGASVARPADLGVTGRLERRRSLCAEEFVYLRARTTRIPKVTLPSPSLFVNFWSAERSTPAYPSAEAFLADVAAILRDEVAELARLGATYIQIDAPHYTLLLDPGTRAFYESKGWTPGRWLDRAVELDNALMDGFPDVTFGLHLCRGNQGSRWLVSGDYEPIARSVFGRTGAGRLLLEYDDLRSGGFGPLRHVPDDRIVVLGLVSTKHAALESADEIASRIAEASRHVPLDRLALSPQCGFASSVVGNDLSMDAQRQKLRRVCEAAAKVWG